MRSQPTHVRRKFNIISNDTLGARNPFVVSIYWCVQWLLRGAMCRLRGYGGEEERLLHY